MYLVTKQDDKKTLVLKLLIATRSNVRKELLRITCPAQVKDDKKKTIVR